MASLTSFERQVHQQVWVLGDGPLTLANLQHASAQIEVYARSVKHPAGEALPTVVRVETTTDGEIEFTLEVPPC